MLYAAMSRLLFIIHEPSGHFCGKVRGIEKNDHAGMRIAL